MQADLTGICTRAFQHHSVFLRDLRLEILDRSLRQCMPDLPDCKQPFARGHEIALNSGVEGR